MAGAVVGGAFLSASLQVLFDRLASPSIISSIWPGQNRHDEALLIYKLKAAILSAEACLNAAGKKQIKSTTVLQWLKDLDLAVVDAQNLLSMLASLGSQSKCSMRSSRSNSLETTLERLEYILRLKEEYYAFGFNLVEKPSGQQPTTSLIKETSIYGRDDDINAILSMLVENNIADGERVYVVSIVGVAGIGKTTLAQIVFNHARVEEYFDLKIWLCTSSGLDIYLATNTILEAITNMPCQIKDLNQLQLRLKEEVVGKRVLLVLDDVCNENYEEWELLQSPFRHCARGSAIAITTCSEITAETISTMQPYHLQSLSFEDMWSLFEKYVSKRRSLAAANPQLEAVGKEIIGRCSGLPGAAKAFGIYLSTRTDPQEWITVLEHDSWNLSHEPSVILTSLNNGAHIRRRRIHQNGASTRAHIMVSRNPQSRTLNGIEKRTKVAIFFALWIMALSILGALVFDSVNGVYTAKKTNELGASCDLKARVLQDRFMFHLNQLEVIGTLVARFYYSKNAIDSKKEILASYINITAHLHPFFSGVLYAERVVKEDRLKFERRHGWKIKAMMTYNQEINNSLPEPIQDEYAPVIFYGDDHLRHLVSLDMMSGKEDRENVIKARDTGCISLSRPFRLLKPAGHRGFIMTYPVYQTDLPYNSTSEDRIRATVGYTGGIFDFEAFTTNVFFEPNDSKTIWNMSIYDITNSSDSIPMYGDYYYAENHGSTIHVSPLELGDSAQKHIVICRYVKKPRYTWVAATFTLLFLMFGFFLGILLCCTAVYLRKIREASFETT